MSTGLIVGDDGLARCAWAASDAEYRRYHDEEWGVALHGDRALFEKISLEAFQSGLSWITILRRRPGFRDAFRGFGIDEVADFDDDHVERLLADERIIRNRAKVTATIANARAVQLLVRDDEGALDRLVWSFRPAARTTPLGHYREAPASTPESAALSAELQRRGLRFVGPTTMYALMQSAGLVDDHVDGCWRGRAPGRV